MICWSSLLKQEQKTWRHIPLVGSLWWTTVHKSILRLVILQVWHSAHVISSNKMDHHSPVARKGTHTVAQTRCPVFRQLKCPDQMGKWILFAITNSTLFIAKHAPPQLFKITHSSASLRVSSMHWNSQRSKLSLYLTRLMSSRTYLHQQPPRVATAQKCSRAFQESCQIGERVKLIY